MLVDVQKKLQAEGLETRVEARGLIVSLPQAVLFASGDDRITDDALRWCGAGRGKCQRDSEPRESRRKRGCGSYSQSAASK